MRFTFLCVFVLVTVVFSVRTNKCSPPYYEKKEQSPHYLDCFKKLKPGWSWNEKKINGKICYACLPKPCFCSKDRVNFIPESLCPDNYEKIESLPKEYSGDELCVECVPNS